jgi:hypothetical protein
MSYSWCLDQDHAYDYMAVHSDQQWAKCCLLPDDVPQSKAKQSKYRVIKKYLCTWWLQYRKLQVKFKVSPASLQTFIDTPNCVLEDYVQYNAVHILNVFCNGHGKWLKLFKIFLHVFSYCNHQVYSEFWSPCRGNNEHHQSIVLILHVTAPRIAELA